MSEFINNHAFRQEKLKELIKRLHDGATVDEVKADFDKLTTGITALEITEMEQALVNEGMPISEIQRLCDVHASVFKGSIEDIHAQDGIQIPDFEQGHPIHTLKMENRVIERLLDESVLRFLSDYTENPVIATKERLLDSIEKLATLDKHYRRKENLMFPYMEKYGITAPPQVMWGVDDEIREKIKSVISHLTSEPAPLNQINIEVRALAEQINEMIFKEEEIMIPMLIETFSVEDWKAIEVASAEIGYTLLHAVKRWIPNNVNNPDLSSKSVLKENILKENNVGIGSNRSIPFDAGSLTPEEINAIMNTLPLDMTFVGADNRVKYFTQGKERIFERPLTIIGREVKNCHPPKSVHIVEQIVEDLKNGVKEHEDFWIRMGEMFVYIRYFAVRNKKGEFLGTLELTQNIKPITELEGEKRLRD